MRGAVDASSITLLSGEGRGRRYALEPAARFLFTSGYTEGDIEKRSLLDPGVRFVAKPWTISELARQVRSLEVQTVLSGPYDKGNAILSINAGAGGTESQDWAQMLLRMYLRWAESRKFKTDVIDVFQLHGLSSRSQVLSAENLEAVEALR